MIEILQNSSRRKLSFTNDRSKYYHSFIKWAGGKSRLIQQIQYFLPDHFNNYFEPFVGSGALFFYLVKMGKISKDKLAQLSDINLELINTYRTIKYSLSELINQLQQNEKEYSKDPQKFYYNLRNENFEFNNIKKAARFITLNKTCYNGLYRVNKKGFFNVPFGRYNNPKICDIYSLTKVNEILNSTNTIIENYDYQSILTKVQEDDFIYIDPPYHPLNDTSHFTNYTTFGFDIHQQKRLAIFFNELDKRKCKIILSNSDTIFIRDLYSPFKENIVSLKALRSINCNSKKRKNHYEIIIKNF
jgi:DNA adenine methylase